MTPLTKTLTQIAAEKPEIAKAVYDQYPVSKAEKKCPVEKAMMDRVRWHMAKRMYYNQGKKEYEP